MKRIYRCDTCGSEKTRIENAEVVQMEYGPVVNMEVNCRHCHSINLVQISTADSRVVMEVIGRAVPKHPPVSSMSFDDLEWP